MKPDLLKLLKSTGLFSDIDLHFARFAGELSSSRDTETLLAAALASRVTGNGDICLDLGATAGTVLHADPDGSPSLVCPPLESWRRKLLKSGVVGPPGEDFPLVLDDRHRLYLHRYWQYEKKLADAIRERTTGTQPEVDPRKLTQGLEELFPGEDSGQIDWQKIAAAIAVLKRFSVITGGPGTGKTHTIARILALLIVCQDRVPPVIYLAAPTGKAAARLAEAVKQACGELNCSAAVKDLIPTEVYTIHRLLKPVAGTPYFRHNRDNPLAADMVVVDEASMVDLALMSKLLQALPPHARLLLLGDKDQLASVEAGSVLGDICDRHALHGFSGGLAAKLEQLTRMKLAGAVTLSSEPAGLQDCITVLTNSYRFSAAGGIGGLSRAVNQGDADSALALLKNPAETAVSWHRVGSDGRLARELSPVIRDGYRKYLVQKEPLAALEAFNRFKLLCALKIGPFGAAAINRMAEQVLCRANLIPPVATAGSPWYRGRPVMITRNDYNLGLFNGDIGVTLSDPDSADDRLEVFFPGAGGGETRRFAFYRLPEHETVYALTVHKSQGSEFDHVVVVLPDRDYPLLTRELIYTALTRARQKLSIWGTEAVFKSAVRRQIERTSGLRDALWGSGGRR